MEAPMADELYKEEVECWLANQSRLTLFIFMLNIIVIVTVMLPLINVYYWIKYKL